MSRIWFATKFSRPNIYFFSKRFWCSNIYLSPKVYIYKSCTGNDVLKDASRVNSYLHNLSLRFLLYQKFLPLGSGKISASLLREINTSKYCCSSALHSNFHSKFIHWGSIFITSARQHSLIFISTSIKPYRVWATFHNLYVSLGWRIQQQVWCSHLWIPMYTILSAVCFSFSVCFADFSFYFITITMVLRCKILFSCN